MEIRIDTIIPVLNEEKVLAATLECHLQQVSAQHLFLVDGGSKDSTQQIALRYPGINWLTSAVTGRGAQMNYGASKATGTHLLFMHADTLPALDTYLVLREFFEQHYHTAGGFCLRFDREGFPYDLLARSTHSRRPVTFFGDQGLFLSRRLFEEVGGFPDTPLMEDVGMIRKLRKKVRLQRLPNEVCTSTRRFEEQGVIRQLSRNTLLLLAFYLGVSPERLKEWY